MDDPGVRSTSGSPSVSFTTLGCKVNRVDSESIASHLIERGVTCVPGADADIVVVNTCTVTAEADRKARKEVRRALALPHAPVVFVTGCLAARDPAALSTLGARVVVETDREALARRLVERCSSAVKRDGLLPGKLSSMEDRAAAGFRIRAPVKIEDGCDACCAYCVVPSVRGAPRSTPLSSVLADVERLISAGVVEVVLTGINIGRYADGAARLPDVIAAVLGAGVQRLRLSSIEPGDLTPRLLEVLASSPAVCPHLHVPLQSGSDRVLKAMARPYSPDQYAERIDAARAALPGLALSTDLIAGFPGETDHDAVRTRDFVRALGFARLHVFRFSPRPGTRAAMMDSVPPPATAASRARSLRALDAKLRRSHASTYVGTVMEVLVESSGMREGHASPDTEAGTSTGTTREYLSVRVHGARKPGTVGAVRVLQAKGGTLVGEWVTRS